MPPRFVGEIYRMTFGPGAYNLLDNCRDVESAFTVF